MAAQNPQRWRRVKEILEAALEIETEKRAAFLAEICAGDDDLRGEVQSFLAFENDGDALETAAIFGAAVADENRLGEDFGNYKIIKKIGEGGMGAVYLAERTDGEFRQRVAVKIVRGGFASSQTVLRRFLNERQILAELEHPHIARLVDGGTNRAGMPFFVLEYVDGLPVTDYAKQNHLSVAARLDLFRQICAAVTYAHKNLVIHRDLKPSNILVTADGTPKLLDFGIAKILKFDAAGGETQTQQFAFTPDYASPEQKRGEKLTTATDVYSLGVILHELLTETRPSSAVSRPSSGGKRATNPNGRRTTNDGQRTKLNPELKNIAAKALSEEPERRYSSVEAFAEDVRRFLTGLPVAARRDTFFYRAEKFISRNRAATLLAALVVLALVGGAAATVWQAARAERQRAAAEFERGRAERRFENLRKISNSLVGEIERAIRDLPGSLPARQLLLTRATEQLDALAAESDGNTDLQLELAWAYQNLGDLPDRKLSERWQIRQKAAALAEKVVAAEPRNLKARDRLAMIYLDLIFISRLRGDVDFTVEYNRRAVEMVEDILREAPAELEYKDSFWTVYYHFALTEQQLGRAAESTATARKILPTADELYRSKAASDGYNFMKPHLTHLQIGYGLSYAGDYAAAVKEFETALADCRREAAARPDSDILRRNEANILLQLAAALEQTGDRQTALAHAETALAVRGQMAADNPRDVDFQIAAADAELFIGQMLARQNQFQTAAPPLERALAVYEKIAERDAERMQVKILVARACASLGDAQAAKGETSAAVQNLQTAVRFYESADAAASPDAHLKRHYAEACAFLAAALAKQKKTTAAREFYSRSLELWRDLENKGILRKSDALQPGEIARLLTQLDAAAEAMAKKL